MKRKLTYVFFYFCFFMSPSFGQTLEGLMKKANQSLHTNADTSIYYYHEAEKMAIEASNKDSLYSIYSILSVQYRWNEKYDLGLLYAEKMLEVSNSLEERATAYCNIGQTYEYLNLEKGDSVLQIAEEIANQLQDPKLFGSVYPNRASLKVTKGDLYGGIDYFIKAVPYAHGDLALVQYYYKIAQSFSHLENYDRAEEYILKSIELCEKNGYKMRNCYVAMFYAQILLKQEKYEQAKKEAETAIECLVPKNKPNSLVMAYNSITKYYIYNGLWEDAEKNNKKSLLLFDEISSGNQCLALNNQSRILLYQKKYQAVIDNSNRVMEIAKGSNRIISQRNTYKILSRVYEKLDKPQLSFDFYKQYQRIQDSLFRTRQAAYVNNLEAEYNRKEQQTEIDNQTVQLNQQRRLLIFGGIVFLIIAALLASIFFSSKKIKKQNKIISKALQEKDILLREIHHRVKNNLQLVSSLLGLQSRYVDDPNALEALQAGKSRVKSMSLIHQDLYNRDNLTGVSVQEYLEKLCRELITTFQVDTKKIMLRTDIEDLVLDVDTLVPLGLIINELLTNSLKYAFSERQEGIIEVRLSEHNEKLLLEVRDNGKGMDLDKKSKSSFGHKLIDTLVGQLEGEMDLKSEQGTQVLLTFHEYKKVA